MSLDSILLLLAVLGCWILVELKLPPVTRIFLGVLFAVIVVIGGGYLSQIPIGYERGFHRQSIKIASDLLAKGDTNTLSQAFAVYNKIAVSGNNYKASMEMLGVLSSSINK